MIGSPNFPSIEVKAVLMSTFEAFPIMYCPKVLKNSEIWKKKLSSSSYKPTMIAVVCSPTPGISPPQARIIPKKKFRR